MVQLGDVVGVIVLYPVPGGPGVRVVIGRGLEVRARLAALS